MTLRAGAVLVSAVAWACARGGAPPRPDPQVARAREGIDQMMSAADLAAEPAVIVHPPEAREAILSRAAALSACAPQRRDLGVLLRDGQPLAFDRGLVRDPTVEECVSTALVKPAPLALPPRVLFVPAYLPGGRPQVLKIDPATSSLPLDDLNPAIETAVVVAKGVDPARLAQLLDRLQAKGFEKLALRVLE